MYNNIIIVIYFLIIPICFNINVLAKILNNKRYTLCNAILKPENNFKKIDLPLVKDGYFDPKLIKFNNCSISDEVKELFKDLSLDDETFKNEIKNKNEKEIKEILIRYIFKIVTYVYMSNDYFNSYPVNYKFLDSGEVVINCVENSIPKENFRLFIKDDKSPIKIDMDKFDCIMSSEPYPSGNYRQINNEYFTKKIFENNDTIKCVDLKKLRILANLGLYKNMSIVGHRENGKIYLDVFIDGYEPHIKFRWNMLIHRPNILLKLLLDNLNFLNTMSFFGLSAELNPIDLLNNNQKIQIDFKSDTVSTQFVNNFVGNVSTSSISSVISINDMKTIFKKIFNKLCKDKKQTISVTNLISFSKESVDSLKEKGSAIIDGLIEPIKNTIKTIGDYEDNRDNKEKSSIKDKNVNKDECSINDLKLQYAYDKMFNNIHYNFTIVLGCDDVYMKNYINPKFKNKWLVNHLDLLMELSNGLKYKTFTNKESGNSIKDPNLIYRATVIGKMKFKSGNKLDLKCSLTNDKETDDFRSVRKEYSVKRCFISSNDFLIPIALNLKYVPYLGAYLDLLVPLENTKIDRCDFSFGLRFMVLGCNVSIPLLTVSNSTYILNKLSKRPWNFYIG